MPLVIVTGLPCSGKTTSAKKIKEYFERRFKEDNLTRHVRIVTDSDNLDWDGRDQIYMSIPKEKELRGWLRAEVQRYINLNQIVILDAAAYIKGFRYELHCIAKEAKTQYCIVEKLIETDTCWKWNEERHNEWASNDDHDLNEPSPNYKRETFDALLLRYEKCDENNRWDSPLFRVTSDEEEIASLERIYHSIIKDDPLVPNKSTTQLMSTTTIYKP